MDKKKNHLIYVVEDNVIYNRMVCEFLKKQDYLNVKPFHAGKDCIAKVAGGEHPDIVIQDYFLADSNGIDVLLAVKKHSKKSEFIFLTANENMEVAVNSIKYGAYDYIIKDSEMALKKVAYKIGKIAKLIELQKRNKAINRLMIISISVLLAIVIVGILLVVFKVIGAN